MQIAEEHIKEFQMLYMKHFGVEISATEAMDKGSRLIRLIEIVSKDEARKITIQKSKNYNERSILRNT